MVAADNAGATMTNSRQSNLQTLAALPVIAHIIDGQLEALKSSTSLSSKHKTSPVRWMTGQLSMC